MYDWAGCKSGKSRVMLWGAGRDFVAGRYGIKQNLADFIFNRRMLSAFNISQSRMLEYTNIINRVKPDHIEGYADALHSLATFIEDKQLKIHSPKSIISAAGALLPEMRKKIGNVFDAPLFDRYGCREVSNIAAECDAHRGLHIFGETTFVEVLNESNTEVLPGEEGRVIVTNLTNRIMPLIRYEVGDWAVKGTDDCTCGRPYPMLQEMAGRSNAIFRTRNGTVVTSEFFRHLFRRMLNDDVVFKFQVVQEDYDKVLVKLVFKDGARLDTWSGRQSFEALLKQAMDGDVTIQFQEVDSIEQTSTGKHLYAISKVS
jgi:phenylacetate-CoA ligase